MADEDAGERLQARGVPVPVMIQREATITRFMGYGEEPAKVETFVREVRRAWTMSPTMTEEMRLDLIKDNAGPIVRDEIRCMREGQTAEEVLKELQRVFGERRSPIQLRDALRSTRQRRGETIRLFTHRLKAAHAALIARQKVLSQTEDDEASLVQQLIDGLQCPTLSRYLQEQQKEHDLGFRELRDIAIRWARDEDPAAAATGDAAAVQSVTPQVAADERLDRQEKMLTDVMAVQREQATQLSNLTSALAGQSSQISDLTSAVKELAVGTGRPDRRVKERPGYNAAGQRVCFRCQSTDHVVAACPRPDRRRGNYNPLG